MTGNTKAEITSAIEAQMSGQFDKWHIGISNDLLDLDEFWKRLGPNPGTLPAWEACSLTDAMAIEMLFVSKGVKKDPEANAVTGRKNVLVYIFPV
jgi:hypothetical protein